MLGEDNMIPANRKPLLQKTLLTGVLPSSLRWGGEGGFPIEGY
jgi:hypothetical protein